jgi:hypothetical protein
MLLYKVNRRQLAQGSLFPPPEDILQHLSEALVVGRSVMTGRRNKREWRVGNVDVDLASRLLTGQIGYGHPSEKSSDWYDEERKEWIDVMQSVQITARGLFVFDADSQTLAVLWHPTFSERTVPFIFQTLLKWGEEQRPHPTTVWEVEAKGDEQEFFEWIAQSDAVQEVTFVARIPNPDGLEAFATLWQRMDKYQARQIREQLEARDLDRGLQGLAEDENVREFAAMTSRGYGYVTARGRRHGQLHTYDQRERVQRQRVDPGSTWKEALTAMVSKLREGRGK